MFLGIYKGCLHGNGLQCYEIYGSLVHTSNGSLRSEYELRAFNVR